MKTNETKSFILRAVLFILLSLYFLAVLGQGKYDFTQGKLTAGNPLQIGASYQFLNVTPGVDALVTITDLTGGTSIKDIDDNSKGYDEAFQPIVITPPGSNGFVEFAIDFFRSGTTEPMSQEYIPVTPLNITGANYADGILTETDQVELTNGFCAYNLSSLRLQVLSLPGWIILKNTTSSMNGSIDTLTKDQMATVVNTNSSGIKIRLGAQNTSVTKTETRNRSIYFRKFDYPYSYLLPNRTLLNFNGAPKDNGIEIKGTLSSSHSFDKLIIEKGNTATYLEQIEQIDITGVNTGEYSFTYYDANPYQSGTFYRIRLINSLQNIYELSSVLMVKLNVASSLTTGVTLNNNVVNQQDPAIILQSTENHDALIQLYDLNGHHVYSRQKKIFNGVNTISFSGLQVRPGFYLLAVHAGNKMTRYKILVQ